jgi:hypothetical protein
MVEYGIPQRAVALVRIDGIGRTRARRLLDSGIETPAQMASTGLELLCRVLKLKEKSVRQLVTNARQAAAEQEAEDPFALEEEISNPLRVNKHPLDWPPGIDPYRLRRALELKVDHRSEDAVRVSGGAEPHRVSIFSESKASRQYSCDCADFRKGHNQCKHVLRAKLELGDDHELMACLRMIGSKGETTEALRYSLGEIWMGISDLYDRYNGRDVDYSGQRFLRKAMRTIAR